MLQMLQPTELVCLFIVNDKLKDEFCEFYSVQKAETIKRWPILVEELKEKKVQIVSSKDMTKKMFESLDKADCVGKIFYLVGCDDFLNDISPFSHFIYNRRSEWKELTKTFKKCTGTEI